MKGYRINVDAVLEHDPQFLFSEGPSPAERIQAVRDVLHANGFIVIEFGHKYRERLGKDADGAKANADAPVTR